MTSSEAGSPADASSHALTPVAGPPAAGGPVTFSAVRRAEAQRVAAEAAAREKAAASAVAPARPALHGTHGAPVLVKRRPPFTVRLSQIAWILAITVGVCAVVYLFVIRTAHVPDIVERVRGVDTARAEETYTSVAEIISWSLFGVLVAVLLVQVVAQVSYANRRPGTRWWMLGTLVLLGALFPVARELVAFGDRGRPLEWLLLAQLALLLLGLLFSILPPALRWTAARHDVEPRGTDRGGVEL